MRVLLWHCSFTIVNERFDGIQLNKSCLDLVCIMHNETVLEVFNNAYDMFTSVPGNFRTPQHLVFKR